MAAASGGVPEAYVYDVVRTPRGRGTHGGALHATKPITLVTGLIAAVLQRNPGLDPALIDDLVLGIATPVGDQGGDLARVAALTAGLPDSVGGVQVNRSCASGLEAVILAAQKVRSGWNRLILAGGVESASRVPIGSDGGPWATDPETALATGFVPQGISADLIATIEGFTREDVDRYALTSQQRAADAEAGGYAARSLIPVRDCNGVTVLSGDEHARPVTTMHGLGLLRPSFAAIGESAGFDAVALAKVHWLERIEHVHTAGNCAASVDGAALVLIGNQEAGHRWGLTPRARLVSAATGGCDPTIMLTGGAPAARAALALAGLRSDDIDLYEIDEMFAAVVLHVIRDLDLDPGVVNVNGGAIAWGHPLGATGAMLLGTVLDELDRQDLRRGLISMGVSGGMGLATVLDRG